MGDRSERLERLLVPLTDLADFSPTVIREMHSDLTPHFITRTLKQLVSEGFLSQYKTDSEPRYQWTTSDFEPSLWIRQQVHGSQVKETPEDERPRERLLRDGAETLSNADLLAVLIRVGVRNESAIHGGQKLANHFAEHLDELRHATQKELKDITASATKSSYAQIMAGIELGRRISDSEMNRDPPTTKITSTHQAIEYCRLKFSRLARDGFQEEFHIVTLDTKHKPIKCHRITVGTLDASLVHLGGVLPRPRPDGGVGQRARDVRPDPAREGRGVAERKVHSADRGRRGTLGRRAIASPEPAQIWRPSARGVNAWATNG